MSNFAVTSSPHLRDKATSQRIMQEVCLALAPAGIAGIVFFGFNAALLIAICVATCVLSEFVWQKATKQKVTISDWSAVVTGLLLAYNLPSTAPWWIAVVGSVIAIILVKQMFGGIGSNFMNPALTARAILFLSWGGIMGNYPTTNYSNLSFSLEVTNVYSIVVVAVITIVCNLLWWKKQRKYFLIPSVTLATLVVGVINVKQNFVDAVTRATPLVTLNTGSTEGIQLIDLFLGNHGGVLGETCAIAIILGGVYLLIRGIADWRIPLAFIGTVFVCYLIKDGAEVALYQLLAGGLLLGAFFMATDYATSPLSKTGRVIFGIGCGFFLFLIRAFTKADEGCSFAILFMNVLTPMIDRFTMPRPFGEVKKHG